MTTQLWPRCLAQLEDELTPLQFNTWVRPLQAIEGDSRVILLAPNQFVREWVSGHLLRRIQEVLNSVSDRSNPGSHTEVVLEIGSRGPDQTAESADPLEVPPGTGPSSVPASRPHRTSDTRHQAGRHPTPPAGGARRRRAQLRDEFTFENFVEGKSNHFARAACVQVASNPGGSYNPLLIYGGVGLGKTHLLHAVGNIIGHSRPSGNVVYLHSERFVQDMVKALQHNTINDFKRYYRSADALLIDDIQFFAGKERSQEEFFHTFNALLEDEHQIVLTCDRFPKEVDALEERLKSRFGWGLPVRIEPPELETRVAILKSKASLIGVRVPDDVAFFIAQRIRANVRELEGALHRVTAKAEFTHEQVSIELCRDALRDVLALQEKQVSIENIQKVVAQYYKIRVTELVSKRRTRVITRPRQMAMALAKELTDHSLPAIGEAFGRRDHTTVLHGCRKVAELREKDETVNEDYTILLQRLGA